MGALEILEQWVEPITRPLEDFLGETQILATTHQESVRTFNSLVQDLTDTNASDAFVGDAADSFVELTGEYLTSEIALSGTVGALAGPLAEAGSACAKAVTDIGGAVADTAATAPDVEVLEADLEAMIKAGYTYNVFGVILGVLPLSDATTPEGRQLTWHALVDAIPRHGITLQEIDAVLDNPSRTAIQTDGGIAYIKSTKQGYSLVIVSQTGEIVTAMRGLDSRELRRLGQRFGFNPNP